MLFILFLGLKLAEIINWSWWLVCMPIIILFVQYITIEIIKAAIKLKYPWAIKLIRWVKN